MRTALSRHVPALVVAVTLAACTSHYEPRRSPRLSMLIDGGSPMYVKQGRRYPHGLLGAGLVDAVADNPIALEYADEYHQRNFIGFVTSMVGLAAIIVGPTVAANRCVPGDRCDDSAAALVLGSIAGGLLLMDIGVLIGLSSVPYHYDAINAYNDGLDGAAAATASDDG